MKAGRQDERDLQDKAVARWVDAKHGINPKSEDRNLKSERNPKAEMRTEAREGYEGGDDGSSGL